MKIIFHSRSENVQENPEMANIPKSNWNPIKND